MQDIIRMYTACKGLVFLILDDETTQRGGVRNRNPNGLHSVKGDTVIGLDVKCVKEL